jgi:GntR family transcriptional regulator of arabinose operon
MPPMTLPTPPKLERRTKHAELTEQLRALVTSLQPGDRLPAQEELMRRYKVSDRTVLRSLEDLERAGLIVRRPRSGTFVAETGGQDEEPISPVTDSKTIAVLAPNFFAGSYIRLCTDILSTQAEAKGLSLLCRVARSHDDSKELRELEAMKPRGFVLLGYPLAEIGADMIARGHRAVLLGSPPRDTDPIVPCVCADHEFGGYTAARYLLDLGHRRLAFAFDEQMNYPPNRHPRLVGHEAALDEARQAGHDVSDVVLDLDKVNAWRDDASLAAAYFRQPNAPTGIAVWNDGVAIILLGILHRAGLRVPEDVSVIGFDAMREGGDSIPPLTSIDQHLDWQVRSALRLLTRPTRPPAQLVMTLPEIKERSSCGPPPVAHN